MNSEQTNRTMSGQKFEYGNGGENGDENATAEMPGSNPLNSGVEESESADDASVDSSIARKVLEKRASKVSEEDVEKLQTTLKEKIQGLKDLEDGLFWIGTLIGRVKLLWSMIRDREFDIAKGAMLMVAGGLIYFVLPVDLTPDFIPGFGYIDDAVVLSTLWSMVQGELERYILYLKNTGRDIDDLDALAFADGPPSEQGEVELSSLDHDGHHKNNGHRNDGKSGAS